MIPSAIGGLADQIVGIRQDVSVRRVIYQDRENSFVNC
jgi:hypothetical protein